MQPLRHTIQAVIRPGEEGGFVAECLEFAVVTQGATLDETAANLREAVSLHLDGEDLTALGIAAEPAVVVSMELQPVHAYRFSCITVTTVMQENPL